MNDYKITDDYDWLPSKATVTWLCHCEINHVIKEDQFLVYEFTDVLIFVISLFHNLSMYIKEKLKADILQY